MRCSRLLLALALVPLLPVGLGGAGLDPAVLTSAIEVDGVRYTIRAVVREATLRPSWPGVLVNYTVRREGVFLHPDDSQGGRLVGCRGLSWDPSAYSPRPFPDAERPVGWIIKVGGTCGNTYEHLVRLITLPRRTRSVATYSETTFPAKEPPIARWVDDEVEVWSMRQEWGADSATAYLICVPELRVVRRQGWVESRALPADFRTWPASRRGRSHLEMFVAGVQQTNPELLLRVLEVWDNPGDGARDFYGVPRGQKELEEIAVAVADAARSESRLRSLTASFRGRP